jgi:hypothetical protein
MEDTGDARGERIKRSDVPFETSQPFELGEELAVRVGDLGLQPRVDEMREMLGREDFLESTTIAVGSADYRLIPRTFTWAKT